MTDFSYQQVAATLASGILAGGGHNLKTYHPDEQAGIAIDVYRQCLKQLRQYPEGETTPSSTPSSG